VAFSILQRLLEPLALCELDFPLVASDPLSAFITTQKSIRSLFNGAVSAAEVIYSRMIPDDESEWMWKEAVVVWRD
jgi:hypothetical protein